MYKSEVIIIDAVTNSLMVIEGMSRSLEQVPPALQFLRFVMDSINNSANIDMEMSNRRIIDVEIIEETSSRLEDLTTTQNMAANEQNILNNSLNEGANSSNKLVDKIKKLKDEYLNFENIKKGLDATIGGAARLEREIINMGNTLGNKDIGKAFFLNLNKHANESAYSIEEFNAVTRQFSNSTRNPKKLMDLNRASEKLTLLDPGQGLEGAGSALKEALGGDYTSLQSNFKFNDGDTQMLQSAKGMDDFIDKFNILLEKKGATEQALQELNTSTLVQFDNIKSNLKTAFSQAGSNALEALKPILSTINEGFREGRFQPFFDVISGGLSFIANIGAKLIDVFNWIGQTVQSNWSIIAPIIWGAITAMIAYNATAGMAWLTTMKNAIVKSMHTLASWAETAAIIALIAAQDGLNAALAACPLNWIIMGIIILITLFYAAVGAINHFAGTSLSATGIIVGAIAFAGASIWNIIIGVINSVIQALWSIFVEPFIGIIEWILNAADGGFNSFGAAVANLIGEIISWFLSLGKVVTKIIDAIFGTNWTSGLSSLQDSVLKWGKNDNAITVDRTVPTIDRIDYGDAYNSGYNFGKNLGDKFSFKMPNASQDITSLLNNDLDDVLDKFGGPSEMDTKDGLALANNNLGQIKDSIDVSNEHLELMRDLAEQESIQNFVTLTPTVQVTTGDIKEEADINKIISNIENYMQTELVNSAEGVYA